MRGTPEGRYFAGMTVLYYASREHDNARSQVVQRKGLAASEVWFKGYVFSEIQKQLANLGSVLEQEVPPPNYYIRRGTGDAGIDNLDGAVSDFNNQPIIDNSQLYVALRVTEEYVTERTATPQAIQTLRRDVREATRHEEPKYNFEADLLRQGVIFLREKVESTLTQNE
jgi:hypothetical protein